MSITSAYEEMMNEGKIKKLPTMDKGDMNELRAPKLYGNFLKNIGKGDVEARLKAVEKLLKIMVADKERRASGVAN